MKEMKSLTPSMEDYLETILILEQKNRVARVKDIAASLSVQMPSVTSAMHNLRSLKLIDYEKNSFISLTPKGLQKASIIHNRHKILVEFFEKVLGLSDSNAVEQACGIEHSIDEETCRRFRNLIDWVVLKSENKPPGAIEWN